MLGSLYTSSMFAAGEPHRAVHLTGLAGDGAGG